MTAHQSIAAETCHEQSTKMPIMAQKEICATTAKIGMYKEANGKILVAFGEAGGTGDSQQLRVIGAALSYSYGRPTSIA